jgi:S-DNA-T family DNA segregation ATPase FtsK/SpoIIIE
MIRAQSPFISNDDIRSVLLYVKEHAGDPNYDPEFLDLDVSEEQGEEVEVGKEVDLYDEIKNFVCETGITSKTTMMRSFQITSLKADQFISRLSAEGYLTLGLDGKYLLGPAAHLKDY